MSFSHPAVDSSENRTALAPGRISLLAVIAVGAASLGLGAAAVAADTAESSSEREAVGVSESEENDNMSRRERRAAARRVAPDTEVRTVPGTVVEDEVVVVGTQPEQECRRVRATGTRLPTVVCTPVAQASVDGERQEQQAQDFLRRMEVQSVQTPGDPHNPQSPMIQSGLPTGF